MAENRVEIRVTASGAEQAAKILADVAKQGGQLGSVTAKGANEAEKALQFAWRHGANASFEVFAGVNLANIFQQAAGALRDFLAESSKLARQQQLQEATFLNFAASVGVAGQALAAEMERVSGGLIDSGDAMAIAMRGLQEGFQPAADSRHDRCGAPARQVAYRSMSSEAMAGDERSDLDGTVAPPQRAEYHHRSRTLRSEEVRQTRIDTTAEALNKSQQSQALYLATMEKVKPVVESNRKVSDEWGEAMQRLQDRLAEHSRSCRYVHQHDCRQCHQVVQRHEERHRRHEQGAH